VVKEIKGEIILQLDKKKYTQKEVLAILDAYKTQYENKISELNFLLGELRTENVELKSKVEKIEDKERLILSVLKRAEQTAIDLETQSKLEYDLEFERLKKFSVSWDEYFKKIKEKYPASKTIKKAVKIKDHVNQPGKNYMPKQTIKELEKLIDEDKKVHPVFDPKKKLGDYIVATSDNGFNMEEVLNPGELELEDICKELGLIDGNE